MGLFLGFVSPAMSILGIRGQGDGRALSLRRCQFWVLEVKNRKMEIKCSIIAVLQKNILGEGRGVGFLHKLI